MFSLLPTAMGHGLSPRQMSALVSSVFGKMQFVNEHPESSPATVIDCVQVGGIGVFKYIGYGKRRGSRLIDDIRSDSTDDFLLSMPADGEVVFTQNSITRTIAPGQFVILSMAKPFHATISSGENKLFRAYVLKIPAGLLRKHVSNIDLIGGNTFDICRGAGRFAADVLELALSENDYMTDRERANLEQILLSAIGGALIEAIDSKIFESRQGGELKFDLIRQRAVEWIDRNLSRSDLNVKMVAAACNVSERYLYNAFSSSGSSVAGYIRESRLRHCREALRSSDAAHRTVIEIAMHWGFEDAAHFSRLYKQRFGVSPRCDRIECREHAKGHP